MAPTSSVSFLSRSTDAMEKISSYPYIKETMTEIPEIEMFYIAALSLVPVSYNQVIKEKIVCH